MTPGVNNFDIFFSGYQHNNLQILDAMTDKDINKIQLMYPSGQSIWNFNIKITLGYRFLLLSGIINHLTKSGSLNPNLTSVFSFQARFLRYGIECKKMWQKMGKCDFCQEFKFKLAFSSYINYKWTILRLYNTLSEILVVIRLDITDIQRKICIWPI